MDRVAGLPGAPTPAPIAAAPNTSTPLAAHSVSSAMEVPPSSPDCRTSSDGWPPAGAAVWERIDSVPLAPLSVAVNERHRAASERIPDTKPAAAAPLPNW
ncbi:MAG TPA: hypothetical protein VF482_02530 [Trebonia sp.]